MLALSQEIAEKKGEIESFAAQGGVKVAKEGVLDDIAKGATGLKHVDVVADKSAPVIPSDVTIKPSPMAALKKELAGSSPELKHVETVDRSVPSIEADVKVKSSPMLALSQEIAEKKGEIESFAAQGGVKVAKEGVLDDIAKGATGLKHVDVVADKSAPVIPSDVTIKPSPMAALKKELAGSSPELKHVETVDRSVPSIEADVTLKRSKMPDIAAEIKKHASSEAVEVS